MSKILGNVLTPQIVELINSQSIVVVIATVSEDLTPNTTPIYLITAPSNKKLRMAVARRHQTYKNIKTNNNVMINILEVDDTAVSIKGEANIIKDSMEGNKATAMLEIDVKEIKDDTTPTIIISEGVKTKICSKRTHDFFRAMFEELNL